MKNSVKNLDMRKVIGTVIGGIVFICCMLYFTYAFYNWRSTNTIVDLTIEDISGGECIIGPDVDVVNIGPVLNVQDGVIAEFSVSNDSTSATEIALSLDITSIHEDLREPSFKYALVQNTGSGYNYDSFVLEGNFENVTDNQTLVLADTDTDTTDIPSITIDANSTYSYQFIVYIDGSVYNPSSMQSTEMETKGLYSSLMVGDCSSISKGNAGEYIINLYNDGNDIETVYIGNDTTNPTVSLNSIQGIMLDNNGDYRYYGANPNNYVSYNDELWRIISVGNVKSSSSDTVGETRIKIIKADILTAKETDTDTDIDAFAYDSSASDINFGAGVNDWSTSDLMTELNEIYYNSSSGTCFVGRNDESKSCDFTDTGLSSEARSLIDDSIYFLGAASTAALYVDDLYTIERDTNVWPTSGNTCDDGSCPRATSWTGKVGLMYLSDYAYSTDLSLCTSVLSTYGNSADCYNNWLYYVSDNQRTIVPNLNEPFIAAVVTDFGSGSTGSPDYYAFDSYSVRPTVYLKSNVSISGGYGTSEQPYTLVLDEE